MKTSQDLVCVQQLDGELASLTKEEAEKESHVCNCMFKHEFWDVKDCECSEHQISGTNYFGTQWFDDRPEMMVPANW